MKNTEVSTTFYVDSYGQDVLHATGADRALGGPEHEESHVHGVCSGNALFLWETDRLLRSLMNLQPLQLCWRLRATWSSIADTSTNTQ